MTARRPAPRRRRRPSRSRKRKQAYAVDEVLVGVAVVGWLVSRLLHWLAAYPWVPLLLLLMAGAGAFVWFRFHVQQPLQRQTQVEALRYPMGRLDQLHTDSSSTRYAT